MSEDADIRLWCDRCKGVLDPETAPMICLKCYNELKEKAEKFDRYVEHLTSIEEYGVWGAINKLDNKLEAIDTLMRKQRYIHVLSNGQYSIEPLFPSDGDKLVSAIMMILFPDEKILEASA
uniref:Uncharacterized protein n=1 Tax=viral metagenome TaxID=1070528 RepID=A0A6M3MAH9_9ZZZZ